MQKLKDQIENQRVADDCESPPPSPEARDPDGEKKHRKRI